MPNQVTIQFASGGFIVTKVVDGQTSVEVVNSVGKLNKAVRAAVDELSLLPKKGDDSAE
jgi:hypothetical protein